MAWTSLEEIFINTIIISLNVFVIVCDFVFLVVFLLARLCFLITLLSKCLKDPNSKRLSFEGVL